MRPLVLFLLLLACAVLPAASAAHAQAPTMVRVVHAAANAPRLALFANGEPVGDTLAFAEVGEYIGLKPGSYRLQLVPADGAAAIAPALDVTLAAGAFTTVAATGMTPALQLVSFADETPQPGPGQAGLRVYHLSPDAPAVDLAITDGPRLVYNLPFPAASQVVAMGADVYDLQLLPATVSSPVLVDLPTTRLATDGVNEIFVLGGLAAVQAVVRHTAVPAVLPARLPATGGPDVQLLLAGGALLLLAGGAARISFAAAREKPRGQRSS